MKDPETQLEVPGSVTPFYSHLTRRPLFNGWCILFSNRGSRTQTGRAQLSFVQAASKVHREATWSELSSPKHGASHSPGKYVPVGVRKQSWHGEVGFSSGIFWEVPPSFFSRGKVSVPFFQKLSREQDLFWLGAENPRVVFLSELGETMPSGSRRPSFNPAFSTTGGPEPPHSPLLSLPGKFLHWGKWKGKGKRVRVRNQDREMTFLPSGGETLE